MNLANYWHIALFLAAAPDVSFQIHLAGRQTIFHVSEVIPLDLTFSASVAGRYEIDRRTYDRSGRLDSEAFHLSPAGRDPLKSYFAGTVIVGGGLGGSRVLDTTPEIIHEQLNEWAALDTPGHYRLYVTSTRVSKEGAAALEHVELQSNPVEFDIIAADSAWQTTQLAAARASLESPSAGYGQKADALRKLRFLDTPDSVRELVGQLGKSTANGCIDCVLGLAGSTRQELAIGELARQLSAPDIAITQNYVFILAKLTRQKEDELYRQAADSLPQKQGMARAETVFTLLGRSIPLAPQEIAAAFSALPVDEQWGALLSFWDRLKISDMAAPLEKITEQPVVKNSALRGLALQRLYELDPVAGRRRILEEIAHPHGEVQGASGSQALSLLPDATLPQFDGLLATRVESSNNNTLPLDVEMIGRYSTGAIVSRVRAVYEAHAGKWACQMEDGFVRYFLRVQPDYGLQHLTAAPSACMKNSLASAVKMGRWNEVQPVVIAHLNDADLNHARQAAETLALYGDSKARQALWARLQEFHQLWADRGENLYYHPGMTREAANAMGFQYGVVESLGRAQAWLLSAEEISALEKLTLGVEVKNVRQWAPASPVPISLRLSPEGNVLATVQQYNAQNLTSLLEKLAQFSAGTRFSVRIIGAEEPLRGPMKAVADAAAKRGSIIEETNR